MSDELVNVEQAPNAEKKEPALSFRAEGGERWEEGGSLRGISQFFTHLRNCNRCGLL